ncbi:MAG: 2-hydroxyacid dehydrogenase [Desulfovibrio sp.]|jgi:D-3-phosphoglycerate dehydrogenase|nr:2-hydroxyacid dehydrogenase [Desulfovibrio sp.]
MKTVVLYLDKISAPMEELVTQSFSDVAEVKFLDPSQGAQGKLDEARYMLATNFLVTREVIDNAPCLKMIQRTGVGYDNVDIEYAKTKGLPVSITLGTNASSVAELVVLYMLGLYRKIIPLDRQSKTGVWDSWKYRHESFELLGKTVGIVGSGAIGREVMKRLAPFCVNLIYYDIKRLPVETEKELGCSYRPLEGLLKEADIVTLHVPWLEATRNMFSRERLAMMKYGAILINTARGPVVDEKSLIEALKEGRIGGAGLDVFDPEPFTPDSEILKFDNVITTPHVGAATLDNYRRVFTFCAENIQRVERGEKPENIVNGV